MKRPAQTNQFMISVWRLETSGALIKEAPPTHSPLQVILGGLKCLTTQPRKASCAPTIACIPFFLVQEPCWLKGSTWESTTPPPTPGMKTLKKQWLEVLSTYQFVLCFLFLGKGSKGPFGKVGKGKVG